MPIDYAPATAVINRAVASYGEMQKLSAEVVRFNQAIAVDYTALRIVLYFLMAPCFYKDK